MITGMSKRYHHFALNSNGNLSRRIIMPFKSKAQSRYLFATEPKIAKEYAAKTPNMKKLPEKVKPKKK
jgi:hypothetical protein